MKEEKKHFWLYVLSLEKGKYYVGITSRKDPNQRIEEHMHGFYSAQWVKRYKPLKPVEIIELGSLTVNEAEGLELKRTLQYMKKYGYQNVRGGKLNYGGSYIKIGNIFLREAIFYFCIGLFIMTISMLALATIGWH